jgi:hypothetical protein
MMGSAPDTLKCIPGTDHYRQINNLVLIDIRENCPQKTGILWNTIIKLFFNYNTTGQIITVDHFRIFKINMSKHALQDSISTQSKLYIMIEHSVQPIFNQLIETQT